MRVLIIGGTKFSGPHLVRALLRLGHDVLLFHRTRSACDLPDDVAHIIGDRKDLGRHAGALAGYAPQVVVDLIPSTEQDARSVMALFGGVAKRVVAVSSQDVYRAYGRLSGIEPGPLESLPLTEGSPLREVLYPYRRAVNASHPLYNYDKVLVERVFMGAPDLPGTVLRYPMVYGPGDRQHRLYPYLKRMDDLRPVILLERTMANWRWTKGYVENVAEAVALAVDQEHASGRVYNVGELNPSTEAEWVREIGRAAGWSGEVVEASRGILPEHLLTDMNTEQHLVADTRRIREELGYTDPVPREEALRCTIAWERAHPPGDVDPRAYDYAAEDAVLAEMEWQKG